MCSIKKVVPRNLAKFKGKHLCQSLFFNKVAEFRTIVKQQVAVCRIQPGLHFIYFDVQGDETVVNKCSRLKGHRKIYANDIIKKFVTWIDKYREK